MIGLLLMMNENLLKNLESRVSAIEQQIGNKELIVCYLRCGTIQLVCSKYETFEENCTACVRALSEFLQESGTIEVSTSGIGTYQVIN